MKVHEEHRKSGPKNLTLAIFTVSTSRYEALKRRENIGDKSYELAKETLEVYGHRVKIYRIIPDDELEIALSLLNALDDEEVQAVIFIGGTGPTARDITTKTIRRLLDKELEGFGEIFRFYSEREVGSSAFLSNATAGTKEGKLVFCLPGSPNAVQLAIKKLIVPELGHLIYLAKRK
ncbi:MAG TPA: molybdenum cofactor biosynthesis protein MoaB [Thermofilum sp.]|nr:molybdenum cofactor biosynthesis protein MoaB [Thermofilum sp.]